MNFERGIDPKHSMNIGRKALIIKWFSDLGIDESRYEILPDLSIKMGGDLNLSNTPITSLPDNLTVGGWLDLSNTPITSLPDNLTVGGWLDLNNTKITSLPDNLSVGWNLNLSNTPITSLPDNLSVGGSLDLENTPITSLPDNISVGGSLYLSNTSITSLPDNLTVGGSLDLNRGSLDLNNTKITSLPDNLSVGWNLNLSNTPITTLPDNLTVGGDLNLSNTKITSLPDNISVGGSLYLSNTSITSLPPSLKVRRQIIGFKGKIVKESLNFERGIDPKVSMDIGMLRKYSFNNLSHITGVLKYGQPFACFGYMLSLWYKKDHAYFEGSDEIYLLAKGEKSNLEYKDQSYFHKIEPENRIIKKVLELVNGTKPEDTQKDDSSADNYSRICIYETEIGKISTITGEIGGYIWGDKKAAMALEILKDPPSINESINFERGIEPKRSMKIGKHRNDLFNEIVSMSLMDAKFIKGQDPRKAMDIGLSRYENTWDKINPGETRYSPEEALQYLRKSSLKPYIIQGLSRQPDWTIDYQVKMINYLITHGNFAPFPEIRPEREIPALTMRRIFDELENKGVLEFDRSRKPYIVYLKDPGINESINFERGLDPKASMGIGKAANPLIITSVEEEYWEGGRVQSNKDVEKADQNTWMNPIDDPVEIDYLFNNWEKTIDPFYGFWYQDPDDEEEYIWAHPSELEGEWIEWSGNKYYIPKTNIFKKIGEVDESVNFERGLDPKDSLKIGHYHDRQLEKAREELKRIFEKVKEEYGGKTRIYKSISTSGTGIVATWSPPLSAFNFGIKFFQSEADGEYYYNPMKWNKPGTSFVNVFYGGRKSAQEAANEMIAQWGGKIDESLDFERGKDPKASMDMGTKNRIINKLKNIYHNEIELGRKREMQTLWAFYPKGEDYYIFSSVYPQNWIEDILKDYGIDEFLEFPGKYEEKRSAVYKIKYKIKEPFKEYFKNIGGSYQYFVSEAVNFERGADPKSSMNIGSITILKNKVKIFKSYMEDPWLRLELRDENIFNILTSKTQGIKALIDYYLEKSELNTYLEDLEKSEIRKLRPNRYSASANSIDYYIKPIYKKLFKEFFDIKESHEFVRGMDPKKAMNIGKNKNNFFATIPSMPFMEACEKYPWFENLFAGEQNNLLTAAAKMLQTSEQKVGVGIWPNDPEDIPLNPNDLILDKYIERDEWNYDKEDEVGKFQLIGSSTGEIYIKNQITEDILCILGTIY